MDRTIRGVRWYLEEIEPMVAGRQPLAGPVSNIASWNYPLSVLVHAMLVQLLAGDGVIAKTPTDGGLCALTLSAALMRRCELPVTLLSGSGRGCPRPWSSATTSAAWPLSAAAMPVARSPASWSRPTSATCWSRKA